MNVILKDILLLINSNDDIARRFSNLDVFSIRNIKSKDPKVFYVCSKFKRTFGNLPLDLVPKELGDEYLTEYFNLIREFINEGKETFEECKLWPKVKEISLRVSEEISKHPMDPNDIW